ncbi:hypothetical protein RRSWK_00737 [Rhodopirellula sp. SWK7]|nr:hypothetical protein RRSWK_00737 [Rhodopirellula sp. SWK7]
MPSQQRSQKPTQPRLVLSDQPNNFGLRIIRLWRVQEIFSLPVIERFAIRVSIAGDGLRCVRQTANDAAASNVNKKSTISRRCPLIGTQRNILPTLGSKSPSKRSSIQRNT